MSGFAILDQIFDAAMVLNQKGEITYFNNQSSIFFKMPPRLLKQKKHLNQICESRDLDLDQWLTSAFLSFDVLISPEIKLHLVHEPDTEYSVILKLIPIEGNFAVYFQDKTVENTLHNKYRDQMEELKKTHHQILQADKLSTLGELTATISHEINNPLTIAAGHSEIIKDYLKMKDPLAKLPQLQNANTVVLDSLERVNQIIRNMKDFLHKSEDEKEYCDLEALLNNATEWIRPAAKKANIEIKIEKQAQKVVALANRIKLEQVLINLIKNSVDALKDSNTQEGQIKIILSKSESLQQTIIDVIDNGPGMPAEMKKNLFKPFMTTKDAGRGTGLGLSICAKIIETHRGKIELVESEKGCHFRIRLPLIEVYSYTRNDRSMSGTAKKTKQKRVLVLDNEVQILNVLDAFLKDEDYVFIGSTVPQDALDFLTKASVELIITDFSMPEMTGAQFAEEARRIGYTGPLLYMTSAKFIEQYNKDKKELEISGLIIKPFNREEVMTTVNLALKSHGGKA
ncbi:MAG TPA: ATP-binding protein [Bacteriovoracaceae bacterium]|nr:ATP-binding protein [Bacteriovoracaceae bacterium]